VPSRRDWRGSNDVTVANHDCLIEIIHGGADVTRKQKHLRADGWHAMYTAIDGKVFLARL
jgi:hypothetical protein